MSIHCSHRISYASDSIPKPSWPFFIRCRLLKIKVPAKMVEPEPVPICWVQVPSTMCLHCTHLNSYLLMIVGHTPRRSQSTINMHRRSFVISDVFNQSLISGVDSRYDFPLDLDECSTTKPCKNGAACVNTIGGYQCQCAPGFKGNHCDQGSEVSVTILDYRGLSSYH